MRSYGLVEDRDVPNVGRRNFLVGSAALVLGFTFARYARAMVPPTDVVRTGANDAAASGFDGFVPDGFIRISTDGRIILVVPGSEMGQGIATTEAMLLAEELEVDLEQVEVALAPADASAYDQSILHNQITGGSTSVRAFFTPLRQAGAAARFMLLSAAAQRWQVGVSECSASRAVVSHPSTGRTASYGELAIAARDQKVPSNVPLKPIADFKLIGKPLKRVDTPEKVVGAAKFGIDAVVPGMRYAAITICPIIGGSVKSIDDAATRSSPDVVDVLRIEDAVAVIGKTYWAARKGLELLFVEWEQGPNKNLSSDDLWNGLKTASGTPLVAKVVGNPDEALTKGVRIESTYELPYLAHAALEPINTTMHVRPDGCDVWVSTQVPKDARIVTSEIVGLPPEKINIHTHLIGGGFGRRLAVDTIQQAARFAKQVNYPVKIIWTREQDIMHDRFRPAYYDKVTATLDPKTGLPSAFHHHTTCSSVLPYFLRGPWPEDKVDSDAVSGSINMPYAIPDAKWEWLRHDGPVPLNWWRGVGEGHNVFVVESFIDELALAGGRDPVDYRRALVADNPRARAVLDKVAEAADWGKPLKARTGRGVSLHACFGSFAALVVEVEVDEFGGVSLRRLTAAVDCGVPVNPDSISAQMQGGVLFGLSAALYNGITFKNGTVQQSNFHNYRQLRMNEVPPFEVFVMPSSESPGGMGEVGTASSAPALSNAIFAATGVRLRTMPIDRSLLAIKGNENRVPETLTVGLPSRVAEGSLAP
ncbi:xanthine dehydrogenase family protein molybdopterin-binding subunit [Rhizobium calliandrae]|uniref:Xanthine dehydrogenase family protein molybdopterin-binding subunit n=1 Tax=Rhizobium calliandrae TaxID=1312182 RepID=A0ABT7KKJ5_9HYPH|nr:xanthine dehydrogenase family protein molybdopterin-binding subunit [Rhizobium calliandrae]MDL2407749.1 xanthine dehydrogenase family protein molybdopterin-binding subunit [Rhizobium calliandrae]